MQPRNHLITIIKHHLSCVKNRHFKLAGFFLEAVVETLALVLSCEFCEIFKKTFFYRTTLVAASVFRINYSYEEKNKNHFSCLKRIY